MTYSNMDNVPTQTAGTSELLASDWNTYVRDNFDSIKFGHIVCTSSTRPTGIGEGTMIYETDTNKVLVYSGSAWIEVHDLDTTGAFPATYSTLHNVFSSWSSSWSPVLRAGGTNVTLGTGSSAVGRYVNIGALVIGDFYIKFGSSGVSVGAGTLDLSDLPITVTNQSEGNVPIGSIYATDATGSTYIGVISAARNFFSDGAGNYVWGQTVPFTWAANDAIRGQFIYQCEV